MTEGFTGVEDAGGGVAALPTATPIFGRARELALADSFLDAAGERFSVLRLEGAAGIGKTTVWREVTRRAEERGFRVLSCRPAETETKLSLSALADLLEPVPSEAFAPLPEPQRRALEIALLRIAPGETAPDPRTLAAAVRSLLAALTAEGPLLVAIDDIQWLDAGSASALEFVLRRLQGTPLGWLFAHRLPVPARLAADALVPPESLMRHSLAPLTLASLHHLLKDRLAHPLSRPLLVRVHEASGGNPLFALEIGRELDSLPAVDPTSPLPVPAALGELLAERIPKLPQSAREALLAAAALSKPTAELVERATSAAALAEAEETGVVRVEAGRVAFAHPLYASAVYESASTKRRRELHRRLAELVADPEERARHLALATAKADERIAGLLEEGASLARSRGAWESAADLLEQAAKFTPPEGSDEAQRRRIAASEHHLHAGDRPRARKLLEEVIAEPLPRALRAEALRVLAEHHIHTEHFSEIVGVLTEALEYADERRLLTRIEIALAYAYTFSKPLSGLSHGYQALERAEAIGDDSLIAEALGICAYLDWLCGRGVDWDKVERSLAIENPDSITSLQWRPSRVAACLHLWVGHVSEARERLTALLISESERGDESDLALILLWLCWLETRAGNLATAADLAERMAYFATLTGSESGQAFVFAQRAYVQAHRGEIAATRRDCAEVAAIAAHGHTYPYVLIAASLGLLELSLGNPVAAWQSCEAITEAFEKRGILEPSAALFLPEALEALIGIGQLERAEALLDSFESKAGELDRAWALATGARCRGLLLAAHGDLVGAAAALERALAAHERIEEQPFELARTLLVKGVIERRARRRARAKEALEQALEIFERVGAPLWAERAREEIGRLGLRRGAGDELTAGELRVAELAAQGLTNREVAAELFLSPKTVGANLSRVYRKLGISSRAELGARMAEHLQK